MPLKISLKSLQWILFLIVILGLICQAGILAKVMFGSREDSIMLMGFVALSGPVIAVSAANLISMSLWPSSGVAGTTRKLIWRTSACACLAQSLLFILG